MPSTSPLHSKLPTNWVDFRINEPPSRNKTAYTLFPRDDFSEEKSSLIWTNSKEGNFGYSFSTEELSNWSFRLTCSKESTAFVGMAYPIVAWRKVFTISLILLVLLNLIDISKELKKAGTAPLLSIISRILVKLLLDLTSISSHLSSCLLALAPIWLTFIFKP